MLTDSAGNLATDDGTFLTEAIQQEMASSVTDIENNAENIGLNTGSIQSNTAGINSNSGKIQTNAASISTNTDGIQTNTASINSHAGSIQANTAGINSNASSIQANAAAIHVLSSSVGGDDLLNSLTGPTIIDHHAGLIQQNSESLEASIQAIGTNAQAIEANAQALEANAQSVRNNAEDIRRNAEGVALALAMTAPSLRTDQKFSFSAGYGSFDSGSAVAISTSMRLSEKILLSLGGGIGLDSSVGGGKAIFTFVK